MRRAVQRPGVPGGRRYTGPGYWLGPGNTNVVAWEGYTGWGRVVPGIVPGIAPSRYHRPARTSTSTVHYHGRGDPGNMHI